MLGYMIIRTIRNMNDNNIESNDITLNIKRNKENMYKTLYNYIYYTNKPDYIWNSREDKGYNYTHIIKFKNSTQDRIELQRELKMNKIPYYMYIKDTYTIVHINLNETSIILENYFNNAIKEKYEIKEVC
jgi:hypothetical protein